MKKGIIYCAISPSGKKYYGRTIQYLAKRKYKHYHNARMGSKLYFHNAIRKYGEENIKWIIKEEIYEKTKENLIKKLNEREIFYIKKDNTLYPDGYNLSKGGGTYIISSTGNNRKGKSFEEIFGEIEAREIKKRMSKGLKGKTLGRKQSTAEIEKRSIANTGKKRTEETKEKTRQTMLNIKHTEIRKRNISESLKKFYSEKRKTLSEEK